MRKSLTQTVSLVLTVLDTFCIAVMALLFIILFFTSPPLWRRFFFRAFPDV